jgi:ABC-type nitrate/sulfonate/bicarbonate transport system substrate-binding protein
MRSRAANANDERGRAVPEGNEMKPKDLTRRDLGRAALAGVGAIAAPAVARAQARIPVNIISTQGVATVAMQELMRRQGYLQEFGIEPKPTFVVDGSRIMGSLMSGENDICIFSGFAQVLTAAEKGAKLKLVGGALLKLQHQIYTKRPEIKTMKDLAGKTIGVASLGALAHSMVIDALRKNGVDEKSVRFANIGSAPDIFRAVAAGVVDAGPSESDAAETYGKYGVRVVEGGELYRELPNFTFQAAYTSDRAIAQKRDALVRVLAAYAKLYRFLMTEESKQPWVAACAAVLNKMEPSSAAWLWNFYRENRLYATDLVLSPERVEYMQKLNVSLDVQKRVMTYDEVADMSLARDALKLL